MCQWIPESLNKIAPEIGLKTHEKHFNSSNKPIKLRRQKHTSGQNIKMRQKLAWFKSEKKVYQTK